MTKQHAEQQATIAGQAADENCCDDLNFVQAVESLAWPAEHFHHREHIRLAWFYVSRLAPEIASRRMCATIRAFADRHGAAGKFHVTITLAWMRLVGVAFRGAPERVIFDEFAAAQPKLLDARLLANYFSPELLSSEQARVSWVEPDLRQLP